MGLDYEYLVKKMQSDIFQVGGTPGRKLPLVRKLNYGIIVGYPDKDGCFTAMAMRRLGQPITLDVALHGGSMKEVRYLVLAGEKDHNTIYKEIEDYPGWGFEAITYLREALRLPTIIW